jgi:D-alanyl-lipoteichoic acid acyltransferase DltB (MBOAT superfamily)
VTVEIALLAAALYVLIGRWVVTALQAHGRDASFAILNLAAVYLFFFWGKDRRFTVLFSLFFVMYVGFVSTQYLALRRWATRSDWLPWLSFSLPLLLLVAIRYAPVLELSGLLSPTVRDVLLRHPEFTLGGVFIGISYLAFRTSQLVLDVRNGVVPMPSYAQYVGFAFFAPTLSVGPINRYSQHRRAFSEDKASSIPVGRALLRVLVGGVKYKYLGPLLNQLTYSGLLLDGHPHHWIDLPIAAVAYYLYLYCNFSGFCDIAIGGAGLMGIAVAENFDNPFGARNIREFWNRWHITLSEYMRDIVFSPLSKMLVRAGGPRRADHAIAATILVVFLLVGIWHGVGWNYAAFGAAHGIGVAANHYYTILLKKRLGKERFAAYMKSRFIHAVAVVSTFLYVTATLFLFANDSESMKSIVTMLRAH